MSLCLVQVGALAFRSVAALLRHRSGRSPRISLRCVAAIANIPEQRVLDDLLRLSEGLPLEDQPVRRRDHEANSAASEPEWMRGVDMARMQWVDVVPIDEVAGDPFPPISLAVKQLAPGGVLGIRHRWQPQPLYDMWAKMDLEWFAQPIGEHEWYIFVHRPMSVVAPATKPVIGAEVGSIPEVEVLPRLQVLAEQLLPGQALQVMGLSSADISGVRDALADRLGPDYDIDQPSHGTERRALRITRRP
jgi:hypothetical protein